MLDKCKQKFYNYNKVKTMEKQILHIDVNNAFLSWTAVEMLKNGSQTDIRKIPCIIGEMKQDVMELFWRKVCKQKCVVL